MSIRLSQQRRDETPEIEPFLQLAEMLGEPVWACDAQGCITYGNAAFNDLVGCHAGQVTSFSWSALVVEGGERFANTLASIRHGEDRRVDCLLRKAGGAPIAVRNRVKRISTMIGPHALWGVIEQVDERPTPPGELFYRIVADNTADFEFWRDETGHFRYVSPSFLTLTGFEPGLLEEDPRLLWQVVHPEDQAGFEGFLTDSPQSSGRLVFRVVHRNGETKWCELAVNAVSLSGASAGIRGSVRDVTERHRIEESIHASETKLRVFIEHAPAALAMLNQRMEYVCYSQRWLSDYNLGDQNLTGRSHYEVFPEIPDRWKVIHQRALAGEIMSADEDEFVRADGTVQWLRWEVRPWYEADGAVAGLVVFSEDITGWKNARKQLQDSEDRFHGLAESMPILVWSADQHGNVISFNSHFHRFRGLKVNERGIWDWQLTVHPDDLSLTVNCWSDAVNSGQAFEIEHRLEMVEGHYRWHKTQAFRVETGMDVKWFGTCTDVDDIKRTQEALRESESRFRVMADTAPAMLWVTDQTHHCTFVSRGWTEFTGQAFEKGLGKGWIEMIHPLDRERVRQSFWAAESSRSNFAVDYRLRCADGTYRWAATAGRPRFDCFGEFLGYIGSVSDVHDRKQFEEALKVADRRKDEFLATLAHELRNPLSPILSSLQILNLKGPSDPVLQQSRDIIDRQVRHMVRLIDDLLDVSRISRGVIQLQKSPVSLRDLMKQAIESSQPLLDQAQQRIELELPEVDLVIEADPVRLAQVFSNLLNNAAKYTEQPDVIQVSARQVGAQLQIVITDHGIGIEAEHLPHIFHMFSRLPTADQLGKGGLGIGLSLVRSLVELHGGTVEVYSEGRGTGSTFTVCLPYEPTDPGQRKMPVERQPRQPSTSKQRILVADDGEDCARALGVLLKLKGYEVEVVNNGAEAIQAAEQFRPRLVILDIGMPVMNGYEAAARIRQSPWGKSMLLAAVTGWGQSDDKQRAREAGFNYHLTKPVDADELQCLLDRMTNAVEADISSPQA